MPENPVYNPSKIVGKKTIDSSVVPTYNPNKIISKGVLENPDGIAKGFDPGIIVEDAKNKEIDNAIDFIDKQAIDSGRIALSEERKGVLKDVLKNPNATKEQKEQAILTVQGYDKDTSGDVSNKFYMQQDNNGVYVPKLLKSGQRPPKGTAINSFHGTQADANDDTWYTDLTKSLANGLVNSAGGLIDLAQAGQQLVTGEESEILNDARNSVDFFKFKKDEDLNKSIYNTEGITKWADLLDKDRLDLSPSALWGTFNGLTESLSEFGFGTMTGGSLIKGVKAAKYGLQGVEKAVELGSAAQKGAILFGSTIAQLGDVMEAGKEAGLKGRDLPALALATATAMGTIDAMTGLEGKVMSDLFKKSKAQILKNAIKTVERDAAGNITPQAFKELAKRTSIQYGEMARNASKEIVKDAIGEGTQEAVQDFTQKAAENLWDKMTPDERGQFGTDALSAKSFGSYLNSFATGAWTGIPMALQQQAFKKRNEEQSIHVYDRVKQGEEGIKALRVDLNEALANNDISQSEYEQANFKIDAYQKYHDETKDVNLKPEDERKAFELSFQIQGIKTEIPTNENEISKLDPISRAKVESKQKQAKELQNELNEIILKGEIKAEPVIASKIEEKIAKENDKMATENAKIIGEGAKAAEKVIKNTGNKWQDLIDNSVSEKELDAVIDQMDKSGETTPDLVDYVGMKRTEFNKPKKETVKPTAKVDLEEGDGTTEIKVGKEYVKEPKLPKQPELKDETRTYDTIDNETFNHTKFPSRTKFQMVVDKLSKWQNKEMSGVIKKKSYKYLDPKTKEWIPNSVLEVELEDGKRIRFASSMYYDSKDETGFRSHTRNERLLGNEEGVPVGLKLIDINNPKGLLEEGKYTPGKKVLKIYNKRTGQFLSWAKETHRGKADSKRADGSLVTTKEEGDLLKTLEQQEYNENIKGNEGDIARIITPKPKPTPTQRAEEAKKKKRNPARDKKVVEYEQAEIKRISKTVPKTLREAVLRYFAEKGRVTTKDFYTYIGKNDRVNYNLHFWAINNDKKFSADTIAKKIWTEDFERSEETFDEQNVIEEIFDVLKENDKPTDIFQSLVKEHSKNNNEGMPDGYAEYLKEQDAIEKEFLDKEAEDESNARDQAEKEGLFDDKKIENEQFQKESQRKGDITKVVAAIKKALPKINVVEDATKFTGEQFNVAGKVSADGKFIYINPNYAGLDTPIHEAGHVLIDAMGYNNKIIQAAVKQLRNTPLYAETKERYPELSEQELDKEVLAEAIGREGADIFGKVEDRSKFKAYLDYIFDWLKQKLGMDKNIAKSVAKQIIGGIKTKDLKGVATGKEQLQKADKEKKKPFAAQALKYNQYAMEEGFDAQKEFDKYEQASVMLKEAKLEEKLAEEAADEAVTDEEIKAADAELEDKRALLKEASKEFSIKAKKYLGYLKYKKDFKSVQAILEDKDLEDYTYDELNDLIVKLFSFNDRAAKSVKERAYQKLGHMAGTKQHEIHKGKEGVIEALTRTSDISPLKAKILHVSHFSENNPDMQALALASGKAIIDKLSEANSLKDTHAKLGLKVIQEENKRLGITGMAANRFSSDSSKYFEWMINEDGNYLTIDEAKAKGLSKAKLDYLDFHRETVAGYRESMSANDYENVKMGAIRVDKNFREAYKSEGLIPAFSYYLGGGATNLGRVRILHNGKVMSYSEIEKEIINSVDKKSVKSIAKALYDLLVANIKARYQLKKGENIDEKDNPLELKGDAEYSLNEKGQLVSKFDKPRAKDRGYSKDFYKAMNQFIDESAHVKHISKIMPLVEAVEYLNKNGYMEEGYVPKKNVSKWINDWKALHIFKEPHVNDPIIDAAVKSMRKLVASTTMWFNPVANTINVFIGNYNNWRAENAETLARGNARLFGGKGSRKEVGVVNDYALGIIKKYNLVNQDFDSHPVIKVGSIFSKLATFGTQVGEYQIQGSLGLGLLSQEEYDSFEFTEDKYGNKILTVKEGVDEAKLKAKMTQVKNRVTDIQGKYPDEDRRNIMRGEFGKALFQFKVWMPDWFKERFSAKYINAYGQEKEGSYTKMLRVGVKEMYNDLKKGDIKKALNNPSFKTNLKGMITIGALLALKHSDDDDKEKKKGGLNWDNALSQVLFIFDLEQDKYMVSNPAAVLGKIKDFINAFEALLGFEEDAWQKTKRIIPANKAITFVENQMK